MDTGRNHKKALSTQRLEIRFLKLVLSFSLVTMLISTVVNLWIGYRNELTLINSDIQFVHDSYLPAITASVFSVDKEQQKLLLGGVIRLRGIRYSRIDDNEPGSTLSLEAGVPSESRAFIHTFPLVYTMFPGDTAKIGVLTVHSDEEGIMRRLWERTSVYILFSLLMIAIPSVLVMVFFRSTVARHLEKIVSFTKQLDLNNLTSPDARLYLDRKPRNDELQTLLEAIEDLQMRLADGIRHREEAEKERTLAVEQQNKLLEQLQQSQKMRAIGQLAGGIAHDFNNILGAIIGYTDMSLDMVTNDEVVTGYLANVMKAADRAKHLVSQILTFSRRGPEQKNLMYLHPIVNEVIELFKASLPSTINLIVNCAKDTKPVMADSTKVHEAVMNLATNAVHAMNEEGTLTVSLREATVTVKGKGIIGPLAPGEYSIIEVADTGSGMDEETMSRIFEPFFTTKAEHEGTGLGLAVVFGVMQSHSGNIQIESQPGRGSLFRLYFPKSLGLPVLETAARKNLPRGNESILYIDDEPQLAKLGEEMLSSLGYSVTVTTESREALTLLKGNPQKFDLLITDQTMPKLTGVELTRRALEIRKDLPIILCTGFSSKVDEDEARKAGCRAFLQKPLSKAILAEKIRDVIAGRSEPGTRS